jgi:hypothetical protein
MKGSLLIGVMLVTTAFLQYPPASSAGHLTANGGSGVALSSLASTPGGNYSSLDWTEYTGPGATGTEGWNYSPQTQINATDVARLGVSYAFPIPSIMDTNPPLQARFPGLAYSSNLEGTMAPVLSSNGLGYVVTNGLSVYAFDLANGVSAFTSLPSMDWAYYQKQPWAPSGPPGHLHSVNMVDGIIWVNGFGCQLQGWDAASGALMANLTGLCDNIPGDHSPYGGWGQYYSFGDSAIQVDVRYNEILYYVGGSAEGTGGGRMFVEGCSLSAALAGRNCVATGGACTTAESGTCAAGSAMLWRTFMMPPIDGSEPGWSTNMCAAANVWVGGVPCSALPQSIIQNDWRVPSMAARWNGTDIGPSTGMSNSWGQYALDDANGLVFLGTSNTGPDWNASLRPGPNLLANSIVALNLIDGKVVWADKSIARDVNDYDCNLNVIVAKVQSQVMVLKACKSGVVYGINALSGQPLWILDTTMPNYRDPGSPLSMPFECSPGNATSCDFGAQWGRLWAEYQAGTIPRPHGYVTPAPYRASVALDPLNVTEMTQFVCPIGTNAQCQALAGVGMTSGCVGAGNTTLCPALGATGKKGFIEAPYFMESENAFDGRYFYVVVMDGPMEHDYIGDVDYKGQSGLVVDTNLYFSGQMPTNATILKIDPTDGSVLWSYFRPIYYRGGIVVTGGMVISQWPDGKVVFQSSDDGKVLRTIDLGTPLLAPFSIAPDRNGVMHIMLTTGGSNHPVLGEVGLHGKLGRGYVVPGTVVSLSLQPPGVGGATNPAGAGITVYGWFAVATALVALGIGAQVLSRRRRTPR